MLLDKKDEENSLKRELNFLKLINNTISEWNAIVGEDFTIEYIGSKYRTYSFNEIVGKHILNFVSPEQHELYMNCIKAAFRGEKSSKEIKALDNQGNPVWYRNDFFHNRKPKKSLYQRF